MNGRSYSAAPSLARRRRLGTWEKPRLGIPSADSVLSGAGSYARPPDLGEAGLRVTFLIDRRSSERVPGRGMPPPSPTDTTAIVNIRVLVCGACTGGSVRRPAASRGESPARWTRLLTQDEDSHGACWGKVRPLTGEGGREQCAQGGVEGGTEVEGGGNRGRAWPDLVGPHPATQAEAALRTAAPGSPGLSCRRWILYPEFPSDPR